MVTQIVQVAVDSYQLLVITQEQPAKKLVLLIDQPRKLIAISSLMILLKNTIITSQSWRKSNQPQASLQVEPQLRYLEPGSTKDLSTESFLIARLVIRSFVLSSTPLSESYVCLLPMITLILAFQSWFLSMVLIGSILKLASATTPTQRSQTCSQNLVLTREAPSCSLLELNSRISLIPTMSNVNTLFLMPQGELNPSICQQSTGMPLPWCAFHQMVSLVERRSRFSLPLMVRTTVPQCQSLFSIITRSLDHSHVQVLLMIV